MLIKTADACHSAEQKLTGSTHSPDTVTCAQRVRTGKCGHNGTGSQTAIPAVSKMHLHLPNIESESLSYIVN